MLKRDYIIPVLAIVSIITLIFIGPIKQDQQYHIFADQRGAFGIPNFLNVITNFPFLIVGVLGLRSIREGKEKVLKLIFTSLFTGFLLLTFGSSYYHLSANNYRLIFDRIPIVIIMMSFFSFIIYDYVDKKKGNIAFISFNVLGIISVIYWALGAGNGDLRWYGMVQFFPVIAIPLILFLYKSPYNLFKRILLIFLYFGLAKLAEGFDKQVFRLLHNTISGHSLKHLFMVVAGYEIVLLGNYRIKASI